MNNDIIIGFILGVFWECFNNLMVEPMRRRWRRKCNYNCENCRVWDCDRHLCIEQRKKDIKKGKIKDE